MDRVERERGGEGRGEVRGGGGDRCRGGRATYTRPETLGCFSHARLILSRLDDERETEAIREESLTFREGCCIKIERI